MSHAVTAEIPAIPASHRAQIPWSASLRRRVRPLTEADADPNPREWSPERVEAAAALWDAGDRGTYAKKGHLEQQRRWDAATGNTSDDTEEWRSLDIAPIRERVHLLLSRGMTDAGIRRAANISDETMRRLKNDQPYARPRSKVSPKTARAIYSISVPEPE